MISTQVVDVHDKLKAKVQITKADLSKHTSFCAQHNLHVACSVSKVLSIYWTLENTNASANSAKTSSTAILPNSYISDTLAVFKNSLTSVTPLQHLQNQGIFNECTVCCKIIFSYAMKKLLFFVYSTSS